MAEQPKKKRATATWADGDGIDLTLTRKAAVAGAKAVMNSAVAGEAVKGGVYEAIGRMGTAGTGVAIAPLVGAARNSAILSAVGGGTIASGGGGEILGALRLERVAMASKWGVVGFAVAGVAAFTYLEVKAAVRKRDERERVELVADEKPAVEK